jgi:hypothetical protein
MLDLSLITGSLLADNLYCSINLLLIILRLLLHDINLRDFSRFLLHQVQNPHQEHFISLFIIFGKGLLPLVFHACILSPFNGWICQNHL